MKKHLGVLVVAAMLATSMATAFAADLPKKASDPKMIKFNKEFCKTVTHKPLITVCVGGDPEHAQFNQRIQNIVDRGTEKLLAKYKQQSSVKKPDIKHSTDCGTMPDMSDMAAYMAWMMCIATPPPPPPPTSMCNYMDWDPAQCGAATFCDANPGDGHCPSDCDWDDWHDPYCGAATYCDANPGDGRCPSMCNYMDWHDPYCGAATFCDANPGDGHCPSDCDWDDWHDPYCGAATFCDANPGDGRCPSMCNYMDWHDPYCGAATYCIANPGDTIHCSP